MDRNYNLFVADSFNHVIRRISRDGQVSTVTGIAGSHGAADGVNGQARFFNPYGLAFGSDGSLFVADAYNELIRLVLVPFQVAIQPSSVDQTMTISWDSVIGRKYQVQFREVFDSASWLDLSAPVTATNRTASQTDDTAGLAVQRLYRVTEVR